MTLEELSATLPNGFHDSYVSTLTVDYVHRKAILDVQVWIGSMGRACRSGSREVAGWAS